jgi:hypothetical protein
MPIMTNRHAPLLLLTLVAAAACGPAPSPSISAPAPAVPAPAPPVPVPRATTVTRAAPPQSSPKENASESDEAACAPALSLTFGEGIYNEGENRGLVHERASRYHSRLGAPIGFDGVRTPTVDAITTRGFRLVAAVGMGTKTEPTATLVLLTTAPPARATPDSPAGAWSLPLHRAVLRCVPGKGFELIDEPHDLGRGAIIGFRGVQAVGASFASIALRIAPDARAARTELLLFGRETSTSPWQLHDLSGALPTHDETLMGSGWYDFDGGYAYLSASRRGAKVELRVVATLTQNKLQRKSPPVAWAIVGGPGPLPETCRQDATPLDCAQLGARHRGLLSPEITWIGGVWPSTSFARAARATIDDPNVYWSAVGVRQQPTPQSTTKSLTQIKWRKAPSPPAP